MKYVEQTQSLPDFDFNTFPKLCLCLLILKLINTANHILENFLVRYMSQRLKYFSLNEMNLPFVIVNAENS